MDKANKKKLTGLIVIFVVAVVAMIVFAALWVIEARAMRQAENFFDGIAIEMVQMPITTTPFATNSSQNVVINTDEDEYNDEEEFVFVLPEIDFDSMRGSMPNIVGWIQSPGTPINYPIVHGSDNDFYLNHLPDGRRNVIGSIFLDYRNEADFSSPVMFIYGHNMASGNKFSSLRNYTRNDFFVNHSSMIVFTPAQNYQLRIFAGYDIDSSLEHPPMYFDTEADFESFLADMRRRSYIRSGFEPEFGDTIVFLVTCIYTNNSPWRRIIVGVLESFDV